MTTTTFPKIDTRQSFFKLFFKGKVGTVKIKLLFIWHPVSATTTFPLNLSVEWRRYHVFPPKWRWSTRALYLAFVCLLVSLMVLACVRGRYRKGKGNGARQWCVFARSIFLSPLAPDTQVMMVLKGRLHEMDYRGTLCRREVSLFRLEVHKRNAI